MAGAGSSPSRTATAPSKRGRECAALSKDNPMTPSTLRAAPLLSVGRASDLTRAVDEHGQREFMGAETYWI